MRLVRYVMAAPEQEVVPMCSFVWVKMRGADEYRMLKKTVASWRLAARKVGRAKKFVLIRCRLHSLMSAS